MSLLQTMFHFLQGRKEGIKNIQQMLKYSNLQILQDMKTQLLAKVLNKKLSHDIGYHHSNKYLYHVVYIAGNFSCICSTDLSIIIHSYSISFNNVMLFSLNKQIQPFLRKLRHFPSSLLHTYAPVKKWSLVKSGAMHINQKK